MIGLGIITYNRPEYFKQSIQGIIDHLLEAVDVIYVYNDGSTSEYDYSDLPDKIVVHHDTQNKGVAHAKNQCLRYLMDKGCDFLFLSEDDVVVQNKGAVVQYIALSRALGTHHLMFANHGPGNDEGTIAEKEGLYEVFKTCVGAWCYYTRDAIKKVGYMDENFSNAWEHMEHTYRICKENMCAPFGHFMDVWDSTQYIKEIPGSIDKSAIRQDKVWREKMLKGLYYWKSKDPKNFPMQHSINLIEGGGKMI